MGAYSYSEGLEALVNGGQLPTGEALRGWLVQQLRHGSIRIDGAVLLRAYAAAQREDHSQVNHWNQWLGAMRETTELRQSSQQMGRSLLKLFAEIAPDSPDWLAVLNDPCQWAIAFALAASQWQIPPDLTLLAYLQTWATHSLNAGVKLIPLGQTEGQQLLHSLGAELSQAREAITQLEDQDLDSCGWGLAIASMAHETQYTRLFRS